MYSRSCIKLVENILEQEFPTQSFIVRLGKVEIHPKLSASEKDALLNQLAVAGFPEAKNHDQQITEKIKIAAVELIFQAMNINSLIRNSDYISDKLQMPYDKLSRIFSKTTGTTLEKYLIVLKIEKVKELLERDEFTLSEIAYMLGYSSVQYLSNQFRKVSGFTVSEYKQNLERERIPLEDLLHCEQYRSFFQA